MGFVVVVGVSVVTDADVGVGEGVVWLVVSIILDVVEGVSVEVVGVVVVVSTAELPQATAKSNVTSNATSKNSVVFFINILSVYKFLRIEPFYFTIDSFFCQ